MKIFLNLLVACFLVFTNTYGQTTTTTFSPTSTIGVQSDYTSGSGTVTYTTTSANTVQYWSLLQSTTQQIIRYKFTHSAFLNSEITRITLTATISDSDSDPAYPSISHVRMPNATCGTATALSTIMSCAGSSPSVFDQGISTNNIQSTTNTYIIHDPNLEVDNSAYWDANSTSLYIALTPWQGTLSVSNVKLNITYSTPPINNNTISGTQTIFAGATASTLTGSLPTGGNGTYSYQWQSSSDGTNYVNAAGSQNCSPGAVNATTYYKRIVTSGTVSSTSNVVMVNVYPQLSNYQITSGNQTLTCGSSYFDPAVITAALPAGGNGVFNYQWQSSTNQINWVNVGTLQNYDPPALPNTAPYQTTYYKRIVTSGTYSATSGIVSVSFSIPDPITNNSLAYGSDNKAITCSGNANLTQISGSLPSGGNSSYNYQWVYSTDGGTTKTNFSGATSQNFTPPAISVYTQIYRVVNTNNCNLQVTSNAIGVYPAFTNNTISGTQSFITCIADPTVLTGTTPGSGPAEYQWQSSIDNSNWVNISGTNTPNYDPPTISQTTYYRRLFRNDNSCTLQPSNTLTISITPTNTTVTAATPGNKTNFCSNQSLTITAATAQPGSTYQWYKDGNILNGSTSLNYNATAAGNYYVIANNTCGSFNSNVIGLAITNPPSVSIGSGISTCFYQKTTLNPSISSSASPNTYNWSGATSQLSCTNCQNPVFNSSTSGNQALTLTVTDANGCAGSTSTTISVGNRNSGISNDIVYIPDGLSTGAPINQPMAIAGYLGVIGNTCTISYTPYPIVFRAGEYFQLNPGVTFTEGTTITCQIYDICTINNNYRLEETTETIDSVNDQLSIYPNPTSNVVNVVFSGEETDEKAEFNIYDLSGNQLPLYPSKLDNSQYIIDFTGYATGVYLVKIKTENQISTHKLFVNP